MMIGQRMPRFILHADFDAFFVSVERACNPSLRGRPLAIGGTPEARGIVIAASQEARAFGVRPSMPVSGARKLCGDLVVVQGNDGLYRRASRAVIDHFRRFTPRYETASVDAAYLDLTGVQKLFGPAVDVGARLRRDDPIVRSVPAASARRPALGPPGRRRQRLRLPPCSRAPAPPTSVTPRRRALQAVPEHRPDGSSAGSIRNPPHRLPRPRCAAVRPRSARLAPTSP